ncbi:hypothetical protein ACFV3R_04315 [Streptomyces sp. NPDC059740]|uniref:hypothetical protein n=1 Tax=Streptomyces sp. NPDC059740 TaxID=3346926 RepID=UPI00364E2C69
MPRPTSAQIVYGSATVLLATLTMLLLSGTRTVAGITVVTVAGLALGLLVAVTAPAVAPPLPRRPPAPAEAAAPGGPVVTGVAGDGPVVARGGWDGLGPDGQ